MVKNKFANIEGEIALSDDIVPLISEKYVVVDIGCGHGDFIIEYAPKYPERLFLGVEIKRKRLKKTQLRLTKRNIKNFGLIHADGEKALRFLFPNNSVDEIHINFPDPWLRKKQWKNRILKPSFVIEIYRVLKADGKLYFVTDVREYAEYAANVLSEFPFIRSVYPDIIEKNIYESFPTLFFRKMSPLRDINYMLFEKNKDFEF